MVDDSCCEYSLDELDGVLENTSGLNSGLVEQCYLAREKKIKDLSLNDIRILLSQGMGLKYIVPIALSILEENPLTFSGLYKGDLLVAILKISGDFWGENKILNNRLVEIKIEIEEI